MNPDIITSAPRPEDLPPIARAARAPARGRGDAPSAPRAVTRRAPLEALARTLIRSIAGARPVRALEAFVDRWIAADEAQQQAAEAAAAAHVLRVYLQLA